MSPKTWDYLQSLKTCGYLQSEHGKGSSTEDANSLGSLGSTTSELRKRGGGGNRGNSSNAVVVVAVGVVVAGRSRGRNNDDLSVGLGSGSVGRLER
jgi:hypothetical protein